METMTITDTSDDDKPRQPSHQNEQVIAHQTIGGGNAVPSRSVGERNWTSDDTALHLNVEAERPQRTIGGGDVVPSRSTGERNWSSGDEPLHPIVGVEGSFNRSQRTNRDADRTRRRRRRCRRNRRSNVEDSQRILTLTDDIDETGYNTDEVDNYLREPQRPGSETVEGMGNQHEYDESNRLPDDNREHDIIHADVVNDIEGATANNNAIIYASPLRELSDTNDDAISRLNEPLCNALKCCTYGRLLLCTICGVVSALIFLASFITGFLMKRNNPDANPDVIVSGAPTFNPTLSPTTSPSVQMDQIQGKVSSTPTYSTKWEQIGSTIYGDRDYMYFGYPIFFLDNGSRFWSGGVGVVQEYKWEGFWSFKGGLPHFYGVQVTSISISSNEHHMVVGSPFWGDDLGIVIIYNKENKNNWVLKSQFIGDSEDSKFGFCVDITDDGKLVAAGSYKVGYLKMIGTEDTEYKVINKFKTVYAYALVLSSDGKRLITNAPGVEAISGNWRDNVHVINPHDGSLIQEIVSDFNTDRSSFGSALALSADDSHLAVGAYSDGYVMIYEFDYQKNRFVQYGDKLFGVTNTWFGYSMSLSADGSRLAVGAPQYNQGGMTLVYDKNATGWTARGELIGEVPFDLSGSFVTLSEDGNKLAIGAFYSDGGAIDGGQVKVYEFVPG